MTYLLLFSMFIYIYHVHFRLRSPKAPDEKADMGTHQFTYAVMPHQGEVKGHRIDCQVKVTYTVYVKSGIEKY